MIEDILLAWLQHWGWLWMLIGFLGYIVIVGVAND